MFAPVRDAFLRLFRRDLLDDLTAAIDARSPEPDPAIVTLVSIIFTTAPKTFTGDAVFVTGTIVGAPIAQTPSSRATATSSSSSSISTSSSQPPPTTMATSPSPNQLAVTSTPTATATAAPAASGGMSGGAKAGLAFGIILLLGLVGAFVLFMYKKRKEQNDEHQRLDDEKTFFAGGRNPDALPSHAAPANGRAATFDSEMQSIPPRDPAPQLSVRAVSQFEPAIASQSAPRASALTTNAEAAAIAAATTAAVASATAAAASAKTQQPASPAQTANNPDNPFGNHAEQLGSSPPQEVPLPESPVEGAKAVEAADFPMPDTAPGTPKPAAGAAAAGAAAIAAATAAAASNTPQGSSTPTGGPPENVHRVQLDFKPSMEDELEIKTGETVRLLHEYDDGWALCMRMDRSKQGVVPRTCLSKHPVKPRPSSPARGNPRGPQGMRGPAPIGPPPFAQPPRPLTPGSGRNSPGPSGGRMSPSPYPSSSAVPRPLTPTGGRNGPRNPAPYAQPGAGRSMSPGPYGGSRLRPQDGAAAAGRNRSNSLGGLGASGANGSATKLPGVSVNRKPVPSSSSVGTEILNA